MTTKALGDGGNYVPWDLEPEVPIVPPPRVETSADLHKAIGNASNICEATFEPLRIKALQPGATSAVIELNTPLPGTTLVSAERLAELYTARFAGRFEVTGLSVRPENGTLTIAVRLARR